MPLESSVQRDGAVTDDVRFYIHVMPARAKDPQVLQHELRPHCWLKGFVLHDVPLGICPGRGRRIVVAISGYVAIQSFRKVPVFKNCLALGLSESFMDFLRDGVNSLGEVHGRILGEGTFVIDAGCRITLHILYSDTLSVHGGPGLCCS